MAAYTLLLLITVKTVLCSSFKVTTTPMLLNNSVDDFTFVDGDIVDGAGEEIETIFANTLEDLCLIFNVSMEMCSCKKTPDLCEFEEESSVNTTIQTIYVRSNDYTVIYASVTIFASLLGIIGNGAVIIVAIKRSGNISSCKLHLVELAVLNFVFSVIQMINTIPLFWTNKWLYGLVFCQLLRTLLEIGSLMTILFILIIALERYILIVHPSKKDMLNGSIKHVSVLAGLVVVVATVVPYLLGLDIEYGSNRCIQFKGAHKNMSLPYHWFVIIVYSALPVIIITTLYGKMIGSLFKNATTNKAVNTGVALLTRMKTNRRIVYITLAILGCFILCTLPTRASIIFFERKGLKMGRDDYHNDDGKDLYLILTFFGYISYPFQSTINPLLYSVFDKEWRKEMKQLLCQRMRNNVVTFNDVEQVRPQKAVACINVRPCTNEGNAQDGGQPVNDIMFEEGNKPAFVIHQEAKV